MIAAARLPARSEQANSQLLRSWKDLREGKILSSQARMRGGGERAANVYRLIGSCLLNGFEPYRYLREMLERIAQHPINRIGELLPWNLAAKVQEPQRLAA